MAKSFAQYASQFLLQHQNPESSLASSQPLFFSFTTDEGSRASNGHDTHFDDTDDPHFRESRTRPSRRGVEDQGDEADEQDPYLHLDEDMPPGASRHAAQSIPLMASGYSQAESQEFPKGWLAHQASPPPRLHSPSPSSSSVDSAGSLVRLQSGPRSMRTQVPSLPPQAEDHVSLGLTQSLLPRDGTTRPVDVFSLPDPTRPSRARRKFNDSTWTIVWSTGVTICLFFSVLLLFLSGGSGKSRGPIPYTTLLHTIPLLTILTFFSAAVAYVHIFLLKVFIKPVMVATSVFIPATLFISAIWAFVGSFMWDSEQEPTWGETVGWVIRQILGSSIIDHST